MILSVCLGVEGSAATGDACPAAPAQRDQGGPTDLRRLHCILQASSLWAARAPEYNCSNAWYPPRVAIVGAYPPWFHGLFRGSGGGRDHSINCVSIER